LDNNISKLKVLEPKLTFLKDATNDEELSDLWEPDKRRCNGKINIEQCLKCVEKGLKKLNDCANMMPIPGTKGKKTKLSPKRRRRKTKKY